MRVSPSIRILSVALASAAFSSFASAALQPITFPGTTSYDGWANLTGPNLPGYSSSSWPAPIGSNTVGSGDATLGRLTGTAYPASMGIYNFGTSFSPNTPGSTFSFSSDSPVSAVKTVVLQFDITEALGYALPTDSGGHTILPTISFNGGAQAIAPTYTGLIRTNTGTNDPFIGQPLYSDLFQFQWDLSAITGPITSFAVSVTPVQHAVLADAQLDQSSTFVQVVPEPASLSLLGLGAVALLGRRRRS